MVEIIRSLFGDDHQSLFVQYCLFEARNCNLNRFSTCAILDTKATVGSRERYRSNSSILVISERKRKS